MFYKLIFLFIDICCICLSNFHFMTRFEQIHGDKCFMLHTKNSTLWDWITINVLCCIRSIGMELILFLNNYRPRRWPSTSWIWPSPATHLPVSYPRCLRPPVCTQRRGSVGQSRPGPQGLNTSLGTQKKIWLVVLSKCWGCWIKLLRLSSRYWYLSQHIISLHHVTYLYSCTRFQIAVGYGPFIDISSKGVRKVKETNWLKMDYSIVGDYGQNGLILFQ